MKNTDCRNGAINPNTIQISSILFYFFLSSLFICNEKTTAVGWTRRHTPTYLLLLFAYQWCWIYCSCVTSSAFYSWSFELRLDRRAVHHPVIYYKPFGTYAMATGTFFIMPVYNLCSHGKYNSMAILVASIRPSICCFQCARTHHDCAWIMHRRFLLSNVFLRCT